MSACETVSREMRILWQLPPGKAAKGDSSERVIQSGQKGPTCWYYAAKRLHSLFKTLPREKTFLEHETSQYRKRISHIFDARIEAQNLFEKGLTQVLETDVPLSLEIDENDTPIVMEAKQTLSDFFACILENECEPDFISYLSDTQCTQELEAVFNLIEEKLQISLENLVYELINPEHRLPLEDSVIQFVEETAAEYAQVEKKRTIQSAFVKYYYQQLGFERSSWNPEQTIDALIKELKLKGPMISSGRLSEGYGAESSDLVRHSIIIVGAEKSDTSASVSFIDPKDPSDPHDAPKLYTVPYSLFCSSSTDTWAGNACSLPIEKRSYLLYRPGITELLTE